MIMPSGVTSATLLAERRRPCSKCKRNRAERFYVSQRGRVCSTCRRGRTRYGSREQHLQETYGISGEEYAQLLEAQHSACAICGGVRRGHLDIDHDHAVAKALEAQGVQPLLAVRMSVRGALCRRCNRRLLPAAQDSIERLEAAIAYLGEPPARKVLTCS